MQPDPALHLPHREERNVREQAPVLGRRQPLAAKSARALPRRDRRGGRGPELAVRGNAEQALDFGNVELVLHLTATESSHAPRIDSGR